MAGDQPPDSVPALPARGGSRASASAERGWSVNDDDELAVLLARLVRSHGPRPGKAHVLLALHEKGASLETLLCAAPAESPGAVLVLGDHVGFSVEEEACLERMGAVRACLGPLPLLTSQCIVLCHNALDCRNSTR